jgi:UDP-2,3-diacylglucosamine pyrophosphatase LpxH
VTEPPGAREDDAANGDARGDIAVLVADLHLAAGEGDPFSDDDRFAEAIADLLASAAGRRLRLVCLGDTFDFPAVTLAGQRATPATAPEEAVQKLDRILDAHPMTMKAFRSVVDAGHRVDLVAGNHDMELLMPGVQARLREALGAEAGGVEVHPWMLYVPGVLYAEHGQQHHDFNRFPWLGTTSPCAHGRLDVPAGSFLDAVVHLRRRQRGASTSAQAVQAARLVVGLLGALLRLSRAERRRKQRERLLPSVTPPGLPAAAVLGIDRAAAATPASIARRAVAMATARLRPSRAPARSPYMHAAARAVHHVLTAEQSSAPFYVFGHTHVAEDVALGDGARYLNPGTWSTMTRSVPGGDRRCGVVVIEWGDRAVPRAELRCPV